MSAAARPYVLGTEVFGVDQQQSRCRVLWLTVIHSAIVEYRHWHMSGDISYLFGSRRWFEAVCALATVEPDAVRRAALGLPAYRYNLHGRRERAL